MWLLFSTVLCAAQDEALQQGLAALKDNHPDLALERLTSAERNSPFDARIRNFRGVVLAQLGRNAEARREYGEAIRLDPKLEDAYKNLGFLEWTEHNLDAARAHLHQALQLAPDDAFAHYCLGRVQLDSRAYENAFHELEISRVPWPSDPDFLIQAATGYRTLGRLGDAHKALAQLATLPLTDGQVVTASARLVSAHENETAIKLLLKASQHNGNSGWAQFDLALAYLLTGDAAKAIDAARQFEKGHATPIESAAAWSLIGIASARMKQGENAIEAFRTACKLNPVREEYWLNWTRELMELNRLAEAISAVQEGLGSNPRSYALHLRLGAAYLATDHYRESEDVFRELIAAGDPLPTSYVGLAQVLLRTGRAEDAVAELKVAEQKLGPIFLISYFRGLALGRAGKPAEAIPVLEDAVRQNPNSAEAHLALGKTELAAGRPTDATKELQQSLRLDPNNVQAQRLLIQARRRAGNMQAESRMAEQSTQELKTEGENLLGDFLEPDWQMPPAFKESSGTAATSDKQSSTPAH